MTPTTELCACTETDPRDCFVQKHPEARARYDDQLVRPWNAEICECDCHMGGFEDSDEEDEADDTTEWLVEPANV